MGAHCGTARLARGVNGIVVGQEAEGIEIALVTLDSAVSDRVDLVKIDVEGF